MINAGDHQPLVGRVWTATGIIVLCAALLVWRWAYLQVENFSHFSELAHENQLKLLPIEPPRGIIYDRRGELLATNKTSYSLRVGSDFAGDILGKIDSLTTVVSVSDRALEKLREAANSNIYKGHIVLREKLTEEEISAFIDWQFLFPEVILDAQLARHYPFHDRAGHVLGFVGRINADDVKRLKEQKRYNLYSGATFIGKTGVELVNEDGLRGALGSQEARVDAHGRILDRRVIRPPRPGDNLYLTLDWRLQTLAEDLLSGERGAAVMMDIGSGELLVLASSPRFDINKFVFGISHDDWNELNQSIDKPLIHRAIYGQYAPGSTIKPFMALSSLQRGWRDLSYTYTSRGFFQLTPKHIFHDWKKGGHGRVDVGKSIVRSVNTYYYQMGHDVGIDAMHDALALFGFGRDTGLRLDNEKPGVMPSTKWKREALGEAWYPGDTIAASVGQGYLQVTPLQITRAMAMIGNGGKLVRPNLVVGESLGGDGVAAAPQVSFNAPYLLTVQSALAAVTKPGGTASRMGRDARYAIAGKTGTAQVSRLQLDERGERIKNENLPKHLRDHAWFVGYAPAQEPRVAIAVIVENSGSGGRIAGPVVRELLDAYMDDVLPPEDAEETEETEEAGESTEQESDNVAPSSPPPPPQPASDTQTTALAL